MKEGTLLWIPHVGVSKNRGTPKWMVYNGNPYQNGWFGGTTISGNTHVCFFPQGVLFLLQGRTLGSKDRPLSGTCHVALNFPIGMNSIKLTNTKYILYNNINLQIFATNIDHINHIAIMKLFFLHHFNVSSSGPWKGSPNGSAHFWHILNITDLMPNDYQPGAFFFGDFSRYF